MLIKPIFMYRDIITGRPETLRYVVVEPEFWGYMEYDARWMAGDDMFSGKVSIPELDIRNYVFAFDNEQDALRKVAELYAEQLKSN